MPYYFKMETAIKNNIEAVDTYQLDLLFHEACKTGRISPQEALDETYQLIMDLFLEEGFAGTVAQLKSLTPNMVPTLVTPKQLGYYYYFRPWDHNIYTDYYLQVLNGAGLELTDFIQNICMPISKLDNLDLIIPKYRLFSMSPFEDKLDIYLYTVPAITEDEFRNFTALTRSEIPDFFDDVFPGLHIEQFANHQLYCMRLEYDTKRHTISKRINYYFRCTNLSKFELGGLEKVVGVTVSDVRDKWNLDWDPKFLNICMCDNEVLYYNFYFDYPMREDMLSET